MKKTRRRGALRPALTPASLGLDAQLYACALQYLFDRPLPSGMEQEWYWNLDEPVFEASPLEWTRIQAVLYANAGAHLGRFCDEQVGMGLNYVMSNCVSDVPFAAIDDSVPLEEAMSMMEAMPSLWRDCIGPRLASVRRPIGSGNGRLGFVCYMWFDVWPTFWNVRHVPLWRDAVWHVLRSMLEVPSREVQVAALHGIGHTGRELQRPAVIDAAIADFVRRTDPADVELKSYAEAARLGQVL